MKLRMLTAKVRTIVHVSPEDTKEVTDRWVINKSDRILTDPELPVLQKGLNFAVTPTHVQIAEFITGIETATKFIGHDSNEAARLRLDCVDILKHAKVLKSNVTKEEGTALKTLKADQYIIILPVDEGRSTVVLNSATYKEKAKELLSDTDTYTGIKKDPTTRYKSQLVEQLKTLKDEDVIDQKQYC